MSDEQIPNTGDDLPGDAAATPDASELETLTRERDENYDRFVRKAAEFDNYRRRVERERREQAGGKQDDGQPQQVFTDHVAACREC